MSFHSISFHSISFMRKPIRFVLVPDITCFKSIDHTDLKIRAKSYRTKYGFLEIINSIIYDETLIIITKDVTKEVARARKHLYKILCCYYKGFTIYDGICKFQDSICVPIGLRSDVEICVVNTDVVNSCHFRIQKK